MTVPPSPFRVGPPWIVGSVRAQPMPITVRREPEVGQAWEAEIVDLGRAALGTTPREAVESLVNHLDWLEIEALDDAVLDRLDGLTDAEYDRSDGHA